jgi:hypothetical protein
MSELRATTISDLAGTGPVALTKQVVPKFWVNGNGVGTVAIRDSLNAASMTDVGTGTYDFSFISSFTDASRAVVDSTGRATGGDSFNGAECDRSGSTPSASSVPVYTLNGSVLGDAGTVHLIGIGSLA